MEFFDLMSIPQFFLYSMGATADTVEEVVAKLLQIYMITFCVAAGLYLICLIFGGIGMMTMAKRVGLKHSWMGFLPFTNTYFAGKLAGETNFFGQKMKRTGLYAMLLEMLYVALEVFLLVMNIMLVKTGAYALGTDAYGNEVWELTQTLIPADRAWLVDAITYTEMISYLLFFVMVVFFCVLFIALFRKYYARSPILMTFLCVILPCRGFVLFAVRNNTPVDYNAYMRRKAEEFARRNQPYGGYNGGYGGQGGYGQGGNVGGNDAPPDPFGDFGSSQGGSPQSGGSQNENPFDEFKN